jgi:AraC family transcriptional regulator
MEIEIKELPEFRVGAVRHVGPFDQIGPAFERLGAIAGPAGLFGRPDTFMLGIYHDDPESTPAAELRSDAAIVVPENVPLPDELSEQRLPAGRYACAVHVGPYEGLGEAWRHLTAELVPEHGQRVRDGASYEFYHNNPGQVAPEELRTELCIPVA